MSKSKRLKAPPPVSKDPGPQSIPRPLRRPPLLTVRESRKRRGKAKK